MDHPHPLSKIKLIDFGLCCSYRVGDTEYAPPVPSQFCGTDLYASIAAYDRQGYYPKDDLINLFFVACGLGRTLPWDRRYKAWEDMRTKIGDDKKKVFTDEVSMRGLLGLLPKEFGVFATSILNSKHDSPIDYGYWKRFFIDSKSKSISYSNQ